LLLFEPFSNLHGAFAGRAQGEYLLYDGCGFFIDDPLSFCPPGFSYTHRAEWSSNARRTCLCSAM